MKKIMVTACLLFAVLLAISASAQEVVTVTAKGRAAIAGGNVEGAKKAALDDAKRAAVEQVGSEVIAETVVENFELVKDVVVTKVSGYVQEYSITDEKCENGVCEVVIEANVSARQIKDDATLIYKQMDKPRVMVVVLETSPSGEVEVKSNVAENTVMEYFKEKGFELVDRNQALANIEADKLKAAASGDQKEAVMLGSRAGAEVVVIGTANPGKAESIRGILYAATPTVSVRALNTSSASIYATSTKTGKGQGGTEAQALQTALQTTARDVGKDIFWKIVKEWNNQSLNGVSVEVVVTGVDSLSALNKFKADLESLEGVKEVTKRDFNSPTATLTVVIVGGGMRLADLIDAKKLGAVTGATNEKVTVKLKGGK